MIIKNFVVFYFHLAHLNEKKKVSSTQACRFTQKYITLRREKVFKMLFHETVLRSLLLNGAFLYHKKIIIFETTLTQSMGFLKLIIIPFWTIIFHT